VVTFGLKFFLDVLQSRSERTEPVDDLQALGVLPQLVDQGGIGVMART
jgi:hypothetical protein